MGNGTLIDEERIALKTDFGQGLTKTCDRGLMATRIELHIRLMHAFLIRYLVWIDGHRN